jgi:hypothetical protein
MFYIQDIWKGLPTSYHSGIATHKLLIETDYCAENVSKSMYLFKFYDLYIKYVLNLM